MTSIEGVSSTVRDKYRSHMHEDDDVKNIQWRHGGRPIFHTVNRLFEQERTQVWPEGSIEELVQNAVKTWQMEISYKTNISHFKTINPEKFKLFVNGREGLSAEETLQHGTYKAVLKTSLPKEFQYHKVEEESYETSDDAFKSALPRGFAWEVIKVYSGPPVIAFKFRHWGYFEGPFKGHAPTGDKVEFYGVVVMKVDDSLRAEEVEIYYDPGELFGGLLKGSLVSESENTPSNPSTNGCPFHKGE